MNTNSVLEYELDCIDIVLLYVAYDELFKIFHTPLHNKRHRKWLRVAYADRGANRVDYGSSNTYKAAVISKEDREIVLDFAMKSGKYCCHTPK